MRAHPHINPDPLTQNNGTPRFPFSEGAHAGPAISLPASYAEAMLELTRERAADEQIMRRAETLAQHMLKQPPAAKRATRSAR